jgi:hypothetical protein
MLPKKHESGSEKRKKEKKDRGLDRIERRID